MKRALLTLIFVGCLVLPGWEWAQAWKRGAKTSTPVVIDHGSDSGGFNVAVDTAPTVLISSSSANAGIEYRTRTFQVTDSPYAVWMGTYTPLTWGSGAGWFVLGSTGSYTNRSQGPIYGILDPAALSGAATIQGPYEYEKGAVPR